MQKIPDETKKGLEHCINGTSCRGCPYCEECAIASDCNPMHKDLQEYIQQLEAENVQLFNNYDSVLCEKADLYSTYRWIPVDERMPLPHEDVAIIIQQGGYTYLRVGWYGCACQWMQAGLGMIEGEVTHWLPLPEPPKGKPPIGGNSDDFVHGNHG